MSSFHQQLVLNQWVMGFFKGGTLPALKNRLGEDRHEGIDDDGQNRVFFSNCTKICGGGQLFVRAG